MQRSVHTYACHPCKFRVVDQDPGPDNEEKTLIAIFGMLEISGNNICDLYCLYFFSRKYLC